MEEAISERKSEKDPLLQSTAWPRENVSIRKAGALTTFLPLPVWCHCFGEVHYSFLWPWSHALTQADQENGFSRSVWWDPALGHPSQLQPQKYSEKLCWACACSSLPVVVVLISRPQRILTAWRSRCPRSLPPSYDLWKAMFVLCPPFRFTEKKATYLLPGAHWAQSEDVCAIAFVDIDYRLCWEPTQKKKRNNMVTESLYVLSRGIISTRIFLNFWGLDLAASIILFNILKHCMDNLYIPLLIKPRWLKAQKLNCSLCTSSLPDGIQPRWLVFVSSSWEVCAEAEWAEGHFLVPIPLTPVPGFALSAMSFQGWP